MMTFDQFLKAYSKKGDNSTFLPLSTMLAEQYSDTREPNVPYAQDDQEYQKLKLYVNAPNPGVKVIPDPNKPHWTYRGAKSSAAHSGDIKNRISINARATPALLRAIDAIVAADGGKNIHSYKFPNSKDGWTDRFDTVTIYFVAPPSPALINQIAAAAKPFVREDKLIGDSLAYGVARDDEPTPQTIAALLNRFNLFPEIKKELTDTQVKDGKMSAGEYYTLKHFADVLDKNMAQIIPESIKKYEEYKYAVRSLDPADPQWGNKKIEFENKYKQYLMGAGGKSGAEKSTSTQKNPDAQKTDIMQQILASANMQPMKTSADGARPSVYFSKKPGHETKEVDDLLAAAGFTAKPHNSTDAQGLVLRVYYDEGNNDRLLKKLNQKIASLQTQTILNQNQ
ncbi:MAG: hypothetical protein FWC51_04310 [Proteobacteria bacterium]|nr:hypothetical protein [Pseudomonadota bacterium]